MYLRITSTAFAAISIILRSVEQHREWMIRSYVLTFGFVTFRIFTQVLQIAGVGTTLEQMTAAGWFSWSVPLLLTECGIQGRKILAVKRRRVFEKKREDYKNLQFGLFDSAPL